MTDNTENQNKKFKTSVGANIYLTQDAYAPGSIKARHLAVTPQTAGTVYYSDGTNLVGITPAGLAAKRPTAGTFQGQTYFATDTFALSAWTGSTWKSTTLS